MVCFGTVGAGVCFGGSAAGSRRGVRIAPPVKVGTVVCLAAVVRVFVSGMFVAVFSPAFARQPAVCHDADNAARCGCIGLSVGVVAGPFGHPSVAGIYQFADAVFECVGGNGICGCADFFAYGGFGQAVSGGFDDAGRSGNFLGGIGGEGSVAIPFGKLGFALSGEGVCCFGQYVGILFERLPNPIGNGVSASRADVFGGDVFGADSAVFDTGAVGNEPAKRAYFAASECGQLVGGEAVWFVGMECLFKIPHPGDAFGNLFRAQCFRAGEADGIFDVFARSLALFLCAFAYVPAAVCFRSRGGCG